MDFRVKHTFMDETEMKLLFTSRLTVVLGIKFLLLQFINSPEKKSQRTKDHEKKL